MKYSGIGGQAVMEGVMMKNKDHYAVAVRKPDGNIEVKKEEFKGISSKCKLFRVPFIRGTAFLQAEPSVAFVPLGVSTEITVATLLFTDSKILSNGLRASP